MPVEEPQSVQHVSDMLGIPVATAGGALLLWILTNAKPIAEAVIGFVKGLWNAGKIVYRIVQYVEQIDENQERMNAQEERMRYLFDIVDLDYDNLDDDPQVISELTAEEAELIQALRDRKNHD